jgi:hypothetical protein
VEIFDMLLFLYNNHVLLLEVVFDIGRLFFISSLTFFLLRQLEYDILEYVVIERLAFGGRDKLKDDGLNLSDWLQSLASFWGHLYV